MTSKNSRLNDFLKFTKTLNSISERKQVTQLEALKAYLQMEMTARKSL